MKQGRSVLCLIAAIWFVSVVHPAHAQAIPPTALKVIHAFTAADSMNLVGRLVQGPDGTLYGVSLSGGTFNQGLIFKIDLAGDYQELFSFGSSAAPGLSPNGAYPYTGVIFGPDGNLYGTTTQGGPNTGGTLFKITPAGELTTLVAFGGPAPAQFEAYAPLYLGSDGNFYGTTNAGGTNGGGTAYKMSPSGVITILHNFAADASEGTGLFGGLITTADGTVYGTTSDGGFGPGGGNGTLFRIDTDGRFSILHYFPYTATNTIPGLTPAPDGSFYGNTALGGGTGYAFSITSDGLFTILHQFGCSCGTPDGSQPVGPLTLGSDGNFYGATSYGGTSNNGTLFRMTPGGDITPLHSFTSGDGGAPTGGLIEGADGRFYGTTSGFFSALQSVYSFTLPPSAPPTHLVVAAGDGTANLTWAAIKGASSYSVFQGTAPGAEDSTAILTGLTGTSTTVNGLQNGTTYYFQIAAANEAGTGPSSAEAGALPIAAPTGLKATAADGSIALSWTSAAGATSYNVYEGNAAGGEATGPIATGITATSFSVTGLANGQTYYFKVASINGATLVESATEVSGTPSGPATGGTPSTGSSGGGGGGAIDFIMLVFLGLVVLRFRGVSAAVIGLCALSLSGCGGGSGGEPTTPPAATYTVGGTVSGLPAGASLILKNNDRDSITVSSNSRFTFATTIATGGAFSVAIATQIPGQTCSVSDGTGTINAANVTGVKVTCVSVTYTIGGTVAGLAPGTSLVLNNNSGDVLTLSTNAPFVFGTPVTAGGTYAVTIATQPSGQTCSVSAGTGSAIDGNVTSVGIVCAPTTYTISGTVTGLGGGTAIVLQNNGGDSVRVNINTRFTFKTAIPSGGKYNVTIGTQPLYQTCSVDSASGTVTNAAITNVVVHCPYVAVLWEFGYGNDGHYPQAGLIRAPDGTLYGTTAYGGTNLYGTVYKFVPAEVEKYAPAGTETVVASFASGTDARQPLGTVLLASDGNFYGTSYLGGANDLGTVFKVTRSGARSVLWSFGAGSDGVEPKGALIQGRDGNLYGTTTGGGTSGGGTVFKITLAGVESVLWNFGAGTDGTDPEAALVEARDGNFYGTTALGGTQNRGTVFKLTPAGVETLLWNFDYTSGSLSNSNLIQAADGNFYGTTAGGGTAGGGTVFKISPAGAESVLWNFGSGTDGISPSGGVIQASDGNFYGTTNVGGTVTNSGTLFRVTPDGVETVLWDFGFGGNGGFSTGFGVVEGADGNLYGVTSGGGAAAGGTLFKLVL